MMTRKEFLKRAGLLSLAAVCKPGRAIAAGKKAARPNILWLSCEDIGPHLGCYGDGLAHTPNLDRLAAEGVLYSHAFTTAPVCAPNRSSIITGVYAPVLGTHHMRSGGEGTKRSNMPSLPAEVKMFPEYLREAGYYCTNNSKQDYQAPAPPETWDESSGKAHWRKRPDPEQPFFAVFNFTNTHEGSVNAAAKPHAEKTGRLTPAEHQDPAKNTPPPYHPDTPIVRERWAVYRENITALDYWVSDFLGQLEEDGLAENTIVFFWSDHGPGMPRCKRWLYDSGVRVPFMVRIPEAWRVDGQGAPGTVDDRLVNSLDLAPTALKLAGLPVPDYMQGQAFLGPDLPPERAYVFGARDRMDERYDMIRLVRDKRYAYIRNYKPFLPYDQFMNSAEKSAIKQELHRLAKADKLTPGTEWVARTSKPFEELYDTEKDPHQLTNLADDAACKPVLERMRKVHEDWMRDSRDLGLIPEPELVALDKRFGSRYAIVSGMEKEAPGFMAKLTATAVAAGRPHGDDVKALHEALGSKHASIRYWAITGLGNLGAPDEASVAALSEGLDDASPTVRVAAAEALMLHGKDEERALAMLIAELQSEREWNRLQAATALDHVGEKARPAIPQLEEALKDTENKYVVRVANRALNVMLGTDHQVR